MDGLTRDTDRPSLDPRPRGAERGVPDDVDPAFTCHFHSHGARYSGHARRVEKYLRRRPAIYVHLFVKRAVHLDAYHRRGKGPGERGRGEEDGATEVERLRIAAGGNLAHVPDDRLAGVEVRGADEKDAALPMLLGDPR